MRRLTSLTVLRAWRRESDQAPLGFVPTLGGLHGGHLSLVRRSVEECRRTVASVFLNPAQFGEAADLVTYPNDLEADCRLLERAGCDAVYCPTADDMYPPGFQTWVDVGDIAAPLEGAGRPGHFRGVATVVLKLFLHVQPNRAYFGTKDFQQLAVVRTIARDLDLPVEIVGCPTVRDADGLALSTRNERLGTDGRRAAGVLYRALTVAGSAFDGGETDPGRLRALMLNELASEPRARVEYASAADPRSLRELEDGSSTTDVLLSLAVRIDGVRLIDNLLLRRTAGSAPGAEPCDAPS